MILRRIRLEAFRCFGAPIEIGPLDERLTILHGPNGVGKTTTLMALERVLFDRPDTRDAEIEALVPWGRDVQPKVAIDFLAEGEEYRLEKTFGARGSARLYRRPPSREPTPATPVTRMELWRDGAAAVEWVRDQFGGRSPNRGATRAEHRGLAQLLFVPQGGMPLPEKLGDGAVDRLRAVVGSSLVDGVTRSIEEQLRKRHEELFTPTGRLRKVAPASALAEQLAEAQADRTAADEQWRRLDDLQRDLEAVSVEVTELEAERRGLVERREALRPLVARHREQCARRDEARRELERATREFELLARRIQTLADLRRRVAELAPRAAELTDEERSATTALALAQAAADASTSRRLACEQGRALVLDARRRAEDAQRLTQLAHDVDEMDVRLDAWRKASAQAEQLTQQLRACRAPSDPRLAELREALADERSAREQLAAARLVAHVVGGAAEQRWTGEGTLRFAVGGVTVEVSCGDADVPALRARLDRSRLTTEAIEAEHGSRDPEVLEKRQRTQHDLERRLEVAVARRDEKLRKGETVESVERKVRLGRGKQAELLGRRPAWKSAAPNVEELDTRARDLETRLELELEQLRALEEELRKAFFAAQRARDAVHLRWARAEAELEGARGELRAAAAEDDRSDEEREAARRDLSATRQRAEDHVRLAEQALVELGDPERQAEVVDQRFHQLLETLPRKQQEHGRREQALTEAARLAPYARLTEAAEREEVLARELRRARVEADAIHLLQTLFSDERSRVTKQLIEPVVGRVVPRMIRLAGPRFEGLEFDEGFRPARIRLRGTNVPIGPDELSFGTRDQLSLLVRLALGEIVAGAEPLPTVLDDPLVHADAGRQRRFLTLLEEASSHLQLIVLTCRPDDYRGLTVGRFVDLGHAADPADDAGARSPVRDLSQ